MCLHLFFVGIGKVSFLTTFYQYAYFIAGSNTSQPGSIGEIGLNVESDALLSFYRLVSCTYFWFRAYLPCSPLPFRDWRNSA